MDRRSKRRRAIELGKDVLIVLLIVSALSLLTRTQILGTMGGLLQEEAPPSSQQENQGGSKVDAIPLRITASLPGETRAGRCGLQYDQTAVDGLFQQLAGLLVETLSSAQQPQQVSRGQWERALTEAPSVCLDFQGEIPMSVLTGWLVGEASELDAPVRRLVLSLWEGQVALYYQDAESETYYRCLSDVASGQHLVDALAGLQDNGAYYAFESEQYNWMDPDTLITEVSLTPTVYQAKNPISGGQAALEGLMDKMQISPSAGSFYSVGDEWVVRIGGDNLRLSSQGVLEYHAGDGTALFSIPSGEKSALFEAVEACRQLATNLVGADAGQARLYVSSVQESEDGLEVAFDYCLNGVPVHLEDGAAAWFSVQNGQIVKFILRFRSYTDSGETSVVLPIPQAAAAMQAMSLEGEELLLVYSDGGGESVSAAWAAVGEKE